MPDNSTNSGAQDQIVLVGPDDSILSIAKENGFFWKTLWEHPRNAGLKAKRKDPEVLMAGDEVYVPKLEPKQVTKPHEARHKFKLKGEQAKFKIQLKKLGKPRANEDYVLVIDGVVKTGKTDDQGKIQCDIPNDAEGGVLKLHGGKEQIPITIGRLNPPDSPSGVLQRFNNLGFHAESDTEDKVPEDVLKAFQDKHGLQASGKLDSATKDKLKQLHPS